MPRTPFPRPLARVRSALPAFLVAALTASPAPLVAQAPGPAHPAPAELRTRAERTGWLETSRYDDVVAFLEALEAHDDRMHLTTMGYTNEGRAIPLLVVGSVADASPEAVRASGKLRVYLQGNIHGGEVPGKEALLELLREIATGGHGEWLEETVLLVAPLYNADGNERVDLRNRPRQHGPLAGMGQRPNAQGLDLNRDHMKLDAPEARGVVSMMSAYDPHLSVDLHTTNGTYHAYHLTYSPPLHPGTHPALVGLLRGEMLPAIAERMEARGMPAYYYGNVSRGDEPAWATFDHRPRFNNNYVGLRNRLAILSEAYAYLTFEERTAATKAFVEEILDAAAADPDRLKAAVRAAEAPVVGQTLPTRAVPQRSDTMVTILMGDVTRERNPFSGEVVLRRADVVRPERMWEYGTFEGTVPQTVPAAYVIPPGEAELDEVVHRLETHGVRVERLAQAGRMAVEAFRVDSAQRAERPFQDRYERTLHGAWEEAGELALEPGTVLVPMDQPLGRLAFYLLEPTADDGFAAWGLLDGALTGAETYPILRVPAR